MNPEIYLQSLRMIERLAAFFAWRSHLNADETVEFTQVSVQLLESVGVARDEIGRDLMRGAQEMQFKLVAAGEIEPFRPSHEMSGEDIRGGGGGVR